MSTTEKEHILAALCALYLARDRELVHTREHYLNVVEAELTTVIDMEELQNLRASIRSEDLLARDLEV